MGKKQIFISAILSLLVTSFAIGQDQISPNPNFGTIIIDQNSFNSEEFLNEGSIFNNAGFNNNAGLINNGDFFNSFTCVNFGSIISSGQFLNDNQLTNVGTFTNTGDYTNQAGSNLVNSSSFYNASTLLNQGTVFNYLEMSNSSTFNNFGTFGNYGDLMNTGEVINSNMTINLGSISNVNTFTNIGILQNDSSLQNLGSLINLNQLENRDNLLNSVSLLNQGTLINSDVLTNTGTASNFGVVINSNRLVNDGEFVNAVAFFNHGLIDSSIGTFKNEGILAGNGQFLGNLEDNGTMTPGNSAGALTIEGNWNKISGSTEIELAGQFDGGGDNALTQYDFVDVSGDLQLAGTLEIQLIDEFELDYQQSFDILRVGGLLSGKFDGLSEGDVVGSFNGFDLYITYSGGDGNGVSLFTRSVPEPTSSFFLIGLVSFGVTIRRRRHD